MGNPGSTTAKLVNLCLNRMVLASVDIHVFCTFLFAFKAKLLIPKGKLPQSNFNQEMIFMNFNRSKSAVAV